MLWNWKNSKASLLPLLTKMSLYAPYITCERLCILIWMNFGLLQVKAPFRKIVAMHKSIDVLKSDAIKILPATFTYCGPTSKITTKSFTAWKVSLFGVFLVRILPHSKWIPTDTPYLTVFSPNAGKYGPEKLRIRTLFTQCLASIIMVTVDTTSLEKMNYWCL